MGEIYIKKRYQLASGAGTKPWNDDMPGSLTQKTMLAWGC